MARLLSGIASDAVDDARLGLDTSEGVGHGLLTSVDSSLRARKCRLKPRSNSSRFRVMSDLASTAFFRRFRSSNIRIYSICFPVESPGPRIKVNIRSNVSLQSLKYWKKVDNSETHLRRRKRPFPEAFLRPSSEVFSKIIRGGLSRPENSNFRPLFSPSQN